MGTQASAGQKVAGAHRRTDRTTAAIYVARIRENCRAVSAHEISWDEFTARQMAAWDAVLARSDRFDARVRRMLVGGGSR
jgi:hypothetical protein